MSENFRSPSPNQARLHYAASRHVEDRVPFTAALNEFDAFVRRVRADALRIAADIYQDEADENTPAGIDPHWLYSRAAQIEGIE